MIRTYRITYKSGIREYVEAADNHEARWKGRSKQPGDLIKSVRLAKEMQDVPLTDWHVLTLGENRVQCATCRRWIVPIHLFNPVKDVARRPCHDVAGNAFCNVACRTAFPTATRSVVVYDYDTWASREIEVPVAPEALERWGEEWTLVPMGREVVIIETKRYRRMMERFEGDVAYS